MWKKLTQLERVGVIKHLMTIGKISQSKILECFNEANYETNAQIFDQASDEVTEEDEIVQRIEGEWRDNLLSKKEREEVFINAGVLNRTEADEKRKSYLRGEYEKEIRANERGEQNEKKIRGIANEYLFRYQENIPGAITDADIERARQTPISEVWEVKGKAILCPFHNDKNPSCHIKENLYKCFSCDAGGDTIRFVEKTQNLKFISAVKFIICKQ